MKIGILTFHCSYNYGAVLQCYALQQCVRELGYEVRVVNYRPAYLETRIGLMLKDFVTHPFELKRSIRKLQIRKMRYRKFQKFEKESFVLTSVCRDKTELSRVVRELDCLIIGSDQVWCKRFNGNDSIWYGELYGCENTSLISYAASAGDALFNAEERNNLAHRTKVFKMVSVREEKLQTILANADPSVKSELVLDPTLLQSPTIWQDWLGKKKNRKYILVRQARKDDFIYFLARHIANQLDADIVTADVHDNSFIETLNVVPASPSDFISLIKNAECVISNSYHGVTLSISQGVPFYATKTYSGGDERISSLLNRLHLSDRIVERDNLPIFDGVDYSEVFSVLDEERIKSRMFLIDALK